MAYFILEKILQKQAVQHSYFSLLKYASDVNFGMSSLLHNLRNTCYRVICVVAQFRMIHQLEGSKEQMCEKFATFAKSSIETVFIPQYLELYIRRMKGADVREVCHVCKIYFRNCLYSLI